MNHNECNILSTHNPWVAGSSPAGPIKAPSNGGCFYYGKAKDKRTNVAYRVPQNVTNTVVASI